MPYIGEFNLKENVISLKGLLNRKANKGVVIKEIDGKSVRLIDETHPEFKKVESSPEEKAIYNAEPFCMSIVNEIHNRLFGFDPDWIKGAEHVKNVILSRINEIRGWHKLS